MFAKKVIYFAKYEIQEKRVEICFSNIFSLFIFVYSGNISYKHYKF
jgi:hypothetical protein